jgi:hypothetical protein
MNSLSKRRGVITQRKKFAQQESSLYFVMFKSRGKEDYYPSLEQLYHRYNNNHYYSQQDKQNADKENQQQKRKKQQPRVYHFSRHLNKESFETDTLCNATCLVDWSIPFEIFPANELRIAATAIIERKRKSREKETIDNLSAKSAS